MTTSYEEFREGALLSMYKSARLYYRVAYSLLIVSVLNTLVCFYFLLTSDMLDLFYPVANFLAVVVLVSFKAKAGSNLTQLEKHIRQTYPIDYLGVWRLQGKI